MHETLDTVLRSPLSLVALTVGAYRLGQAVSRRTGGHALAQPVVVAIVLVGLVLVSADVPYADYWSGTNLVTFWLGPATVALAVPLHRHFDRLRTGMLPILVAVPVGALTSVLVAVVLVDWLGGTDEMARTMAPKAATTPVSVELSAAIGGNPSLTAVLTITAGILGAMLGPATLSLLRVRDPLARGLAIGAVSHGIGTSRSLREDETEGAFAGLGMGLTAVATSLLLPLGLWLGGVLTGS